MSPAIIGIFVFLCLALATLACLRFHEKLPLNQRDERTHSVVKLAISVFVLMTSLVLGLLITTVKGTFDRVDQNVHAFATELILLDRALKFYGPETAETRRQLTAYAQRALEGTWPRDGAPVVDDRQAEGILDVIEQDLNRIEPPDARRQQLWTTAQMRLQRAVELRWTLIGQSAGTISMPFVVLLLTWLVMVFASFGYNAPRNPVVTVTLLLSAATIAATICLILDVDQPFLGPIQVSSEPLERALAYMQH